MPGYKRSQSAATNLTTGLHHELHPTKCPIVATCKIFGSSCPRYFVDDQYCDFPCRSKSGCGPTNGNALTSSAFPDNALTNVSPNIVQQIVQPVHSSHAGFRITPVVCFAAGHRTILKKDLNKIDVTFRKLLRSVVGPPAATDWSRPWHEILHNRIKISESCCQ